MSSTTVHSFAVTHSAMAGFISFTALALLARSVNAAPSFITGTTISPSITQQAGGGPPSNVNSFKLSQNGIATFQLANFLENLESNYFQQGLANVSSWGSMKVNGVDAKAVISQIAGQEIVHVAAIEDLLIANNAPVIQPCQYDFPVTDLTTFMALGNIITSVGIGALVDLQDSISTSDPSLEIIVGSILPVESRHDAFFRISAGELPNPSSFETPLSGLMAYNLALDFIVAGSCPNLPTFIQSLPVFPRLAIAGSGPPSFANPNAPGSLTFVVPNAQFLPQGWNSKPLYIGWMDDLIPVYTPVTINGNNLQADVPYGLFGMAFAVLTNQNTAISVGDLSQAILAGPIPIPVT